MQHKEDYKTKNSLDLNFILGIGRSGTTLLTSLLNQHNKVAASPEVYFYLFFAHTFKNKTSFSQREIDMVIQFLEQFARLQPYIGWDLNYKELKSVLYAVRRNISFHELMRRIYLHFRAPNKDYSDIEMVIDKNPSYSLQWRKLIKLDESARFILAIRDYRANLLSRKQSVNYLSSSTVFNSVRWNLFNKRLLRLLKKYPDKCLILKYEDFVSNTSVKTKELCEFLEIEFSEDLLNFYQREKENLKAEEYVNASETSERAVKKYTDLAKPINATRVEAWKRELPEKDIEICEIINGKVGEQFGYTVSKNQSFLGLKKVYIYLTHPMQILKAYYNIYKDDILYYVPIEFKLKRFVNQVDKISKLRNEI
ncbi:MAG: sulfotransferase [Flavobacteriales bacterium]